VASDDDSTNRVISIKLSEDVVDFVSELIAHSIEFFRTIELDNANLAFLFEVDEIVFGSLGKGELVEEIEGSGKLRMESLHFFY